ncbi:MULTISPECIES: hypothetical protein [Bacillus cereus group]|uniref:hypothetical protein n=1 Tax=Bacillus cereus group TaxID=86661 RepID=UPI000BEB9435|nr:MULTISPECIES: hypothetical protein [Bacillus cereus group]PEB96046.1 hypothetical protein CON04_26990 [Bacillus cereus]PEC25368.1 hypothetical protein CON75_23965 [Bacillus thuringiensis]PEQ74645.1 hypothetical protein CN478_21215 [Bacillus cereus]PFM68512.1 hypothetical protein COJ66_20980 [Bacillus cereus]PFZ19027.1 hypothetical protein COL73_17780 [Bacillus thuringiensis]
MLIPIKGTRYTKEKIPDWLVQLSVEKYIKFKEYRLTYCEGRNSLNIGDRFSGCGNQIIFSNRSRDKPITCTECDNDYTFEELHESSLIFKELIEIEYSKIVADILEKIKETECNIIDIEGNRNCYILKVYDKEYLLIFDGRHSDPRIFAEQEGIININILSTFQQNALPETVVNINGIHILQYGFGKEKYKLRDLPNASVLISRLQKVAEIEAEIIEKSKVFTWQAVENELSNFFLNQIRNKKVELYEYKLLSEAYPQLSYIPVNAAGAGNADKVTIPLAQYLSEVFSGTFTVDAKCYTSTAVSSKTIETVQHHLSKDGFDARRIVIIATTNNVTCWDDVINYQKTTGQYRLLIFSARLMAEVAVQLKFADELLNIIEQCAKEAQSLS